MIWLLWVMCSVRIFDPFIVISHYIEFIFISASEETTRERVSSGIEKHGQRNQESGTIIILQKTLTSRWEKMFPVPFLENSLFDCLIVMGLLMYCALWLSTLRFCLPFSLLGVFWRFQCNSCIFSCNWQTRIISNSKGHR